MDGDRFEVWSRQVKYGTRASSGGGRASARETIGRVAAGAVAEKWGRPPPGRRESGGMLGFPLQMALKCIKIIGKYWKMGCKWRF